MTAPNSSSNALSAREATGFVEGNGVSACDIVEEDCVVRFFLSDAASVSTGFKDSEKPSYDVVAASLCRGASARLLLCGTRRHSAVATAVRIYRWLSSLSYLTVGLRKCSGRGPMPIKRAGSCRKIGNHFSKRNTNGSEVFFPPDIRPVTTRR